jgi:hypothetical protein
MKYAGKVGSKKTGKVGSKKISAYLDNSEHMLY